MDGSQKLKLLIIGKSAKPRCFKGIKSQPTVYRKYGFKNIESIEQSSELPKITNSYSGWGHLPNYGELPFEDYSQVDDDISVHGAEILNLVHLDKEENKEEQPPIPVTLSESRRSLITLRFYTLRTDTSNDFFVALTTIENSLNNDKNLK
ncbi:hypothetical protein LAZ67_21000358 [Cordylochernes scorpioides]|uniref:Uncharacterized protein n=1 Tax=Cordylochernes scorpioides TaxID=51811 RepID=A0ABY6LNM9_9ARAC|nr:hypothetical protein LAZ67_21000358 [Cordylochernes scorpioides]